MPKTMRFAPILHAPARPAIGVSGGQRPQGAWHRLNRRLCRVAMLAGVWLASAPLQAGPMTQPHEVDGVEVSVIEARRGEGDTVMIKWQLENKTAEKKQLTKLRTGWYDEYRLTGDAYFLDAKNRKKHPVVLTDKRVPVAAKFGRVNQFTVIDPHKKVVLWARFQAPPADVTKIELHLPGASLPFEGVEIR